MSKHICTHHECTNEVGPKGAKGLCPKHYRLSRPQCTIDGCGKIQAANGYCSMHNYRYKSTGDPLRTSSGRTVRHKGQVCAVEGCENPRRKHEWCGQHYNQWRLTGEVKPLKHLWGNGGYVATHSRLSRQYGPASGYACVDCGAPAEEWSYDGLDPNERVDEKTGAAFSRILEHYDPRCISCHRIFDDWAGHMILARIN